MTEAVLDIDVQGRAGDFALDARVQAGPGVTVLFGRSGAGKSTLVHMVAGLLTPEAGHIQVAGETLYDSAKGIDLKPEARGVGYVFQDARLFPHMSVATNLRYGLGRLPAAKHTGAFARVVDLLGIEPLLARRPAKLSGGEKQRVAIGRALLSNPRVLLMDEPLTGLDAQRKSEVLPYIERLSADFHLPVLYVSHAVDEVVRLADTLVLMDGGCVHAQGQVEDLMGRLDLGPLTGRYEAGAVLNAKVAGFEPENNLTRLDLLGHTLYTPAVDVKTGDMVRLRIRARDVALALAPPEGTSILNQLPATVHEIAAGEGPHAEVAMSIGPSPGNADEQAQTLLARITRKSLKDMNLQPGTNVHALIKAVAIDRHSLGGLGIGAKRNKS